MLSLQNFFGNLKTVHGKNKDNIYGTYFLEDLDEINSWLSILSVIQAPFNCAMVIV